MDDLSFVAISDAPGDRGACQHRADLNSYVGRRRPLRDLKRLAVRQSDFQRRSPNRAPANSMADSTSPKYKRRVKAPDTRLPLAHAHPSCVRDRTLTYCVNRQALNRSTGDIQNTVACDPATSPQPASHPQCNISHRRGRSSRLARNPASAQPPPRPVPRPPTITASPAGYGCSGHRARPPVPPTPHRRGS